MAPDPIIPRSGVGHASIEALECPNVLAQKQA